jgi:hypothetical protein
MLQYGWSPLHLVSQVPQLWMSFLKFTHRLPQHPNPGMVHLVGSQVPPELDDALVLDELVCEPLLLDVPVPLDVPVLAAVPVPLDVPVAVAPPALAVPVACPPAPPPPPAAVEKPAVQPQRPITPKAKAS